ncbi:hypothetical protein CYL18_17910 [Pradoshia eiseniae]|uniref:DUF3953 domain-containing protein n=1 Tax=Pradoshia eiseniae TaxID=2064768 RepID=A0A2S7MVM3_9BACI|nr:hypothetical protein [Pradoshia eiseniae]PQD93798.1 hypothetical protein CYL18_17910 [Pradoshia eiseniae]
MKRFSLLSILLIIIGIIAYVINRSIGENAELFILIGFICLFVAVILGFMAIAKNEAGKLKYLTILMAFVVLGFVTWMEPFQIVRVLTWLKNI